MSANNWAECPKCEEEKISKVEELKRKISDSYGKVSETEYNMLKIRLEKIKAVVSNPTLREDYEIGIWDGQFKVGYYASCEKCDYSYEYTYSKKLD